MLDDHERELFLEITRRLRSEDASGPPGPRHIPGRPDDRRGADMITTMAGLTLCVVLLMGPRRLTEPEVKVRGSTAPPRVARQAPV